MSDALVVLTTVATPADASTLVSALVEERVVACGTMLPGAESIYRWKGEVTKDAETLILLKTTPDRWPELERAVERHHPYDVPELLALRVESGLAPYLHWLTAETVATPDE